ncbi:Transcriptional regulator [Vibrio crassostreae]|uniref:helix-turn-helix domain-containing protein n=1 Tax=Vibrio TaxID=662 RepID=UPI0005DAC766|nr:MULTISPECIES: helix-turn-helix transcriptional regulator [Vibrio]PTO71541.1 XRE family transcriptional regulator [Vibrio splendidus]TDW03564.1 helix-turn-helix protein [Vibrio crassostreae]CAK1695337.1 Transcriptional regulator [Vibrio crassostreae]CAK1965105.1 Transcriptional regulator [Vibrio crassostreae]CAK1965379.1 Transcriptional regulator [Vibrio crassostreae]
MVDLGKKLKAIRIAERLGREDMSQLTDIPRGTIRNYEQGVNKPNVETLTKITNNECFKKYTYWLMTDEVLPESGQISPDFSILSELGIVEKTTSRKKLA